MIKRSSSAPADVVIRDISVREIPAGLGPLTQASEALKPDAAGGSMVFDGMSQTMFVYLPNGGSADCELLL